MNAVDAERRAEALWHTASERLSSGLTLLDSDLRITHTNSAQCAMLGLSEADIVGKLCREVFPICTKAPCPHRIAQTEGLRLVREMVRVMESDGGRRPLRIEIIPAAANDANVAIIHQSHDLTEERTMRSRLLTSDRLATIGRLAAGIAHEVNNPAAFVSVNLGVLRDRFLAGTARIPEVLAILDESITGMDRIRDMVRDLKGLARERSAGAVNLSHLAQSTVRLASHEARGIARIVTELEENVMANVREGRVAQVFMSLISNAVQAIPTGSPEMHRITIRTSHRVDRARFEVCDTGPGVPEGLRERIFEPFFTTREATGGAGLGLWLARGLVEDEGGTLTVESAPSGGACFVVDLPLA